MCGIAFISNPALPQQELETRINEALNHMIHRGPDGLGSKSEPGWSIGHRRLAIIDVAGSPQPLQDHTGRYHISYNGEVYNYRELREQLELKWNFSTNGDTEVVLAGLVLQGTDFLKKMEGMWSLALWDCQTQALFLSRDRMGKKPLFYTELDGGFCCASEMPALKKLTQSTWQEDINGSADYFRYGYCLPGHTAFKNVFELPPGYYATWSLKAGYLQKPFWQLTPGKFDGSFADAKKALREALIKAVDRRLIADVEVGAFLSGGVDSSLIAGIITRELGKPLKTFTMGFSEKSFDERSFAKLASEAFETQHHEEILSEWEESKLERLLTHHVGQPFADASLLPTSQIAKIASKHVKVALSGDGGDELFSGYQRYQARAISNVYAQSPVLLQTSLKGMIRSFPEPTMHHSRSLLKKANLFLDMLERDSSESPYFAPTFFSNDQLLELAPKLAPAGNHPPVIAITPIDNDIKRMMIADAFVYLPQDILTKVDRASMAQSLEARAPFMDREVVELAYSLPTDWHRSMLSGKRLLRETFKDLLPSPLWKRRKQGFGVPVHMWFRGSLGNKLQKWVNEDSGTLNGDTILRMLGEHKALKKDHGNRLWLIYVFLLWRRTCL